jgi:hypothetical protein
LFVLFKRVEQSIVGILRTGEGFNNPNRPDEFIFHPHQRTSPPQQNAPKHLVKT